MADCAAVPTPLAGGLAAMGREEVTLACWQVEVTPAATMEIAAALQFLLVPIK